MADLERLDPELANALVRYAAEADTEIDAAEAARLIARRHPRHRWLDSVTGFLPVPVRSTARVLVVIGALLLLLLTAAVVGRSLLQEGIPESILHGRLDCIQAVAGTSSTQGPAVVTTGVTLECRLALDDARASGSMTLVITQALIDGRSGTEDGTAVLRTSGGTWSGEVAGSVAETGARGASATLVGEGPFRGLRLGLSLISPDGLSWGVRGVIGPRSQR